MNSITFDLVKEVESRRQPLKDNLQPTATSSISSFHSCVVSTPVENAMLDSNDASFLDYDTISIDHFEAPVNQTSISSPSKSLNRDLKSDDNLLKTDVSLSILIDDNTLDTFSDDEISISHVSGPIYPICAPNFTTAEQEESDRNIHISENSENGCIDRFTIGCNTHLSSYVQKPTEDVIDIFSRVNSTRIHQKSNSEIFSVSADLNILPHLAKAAKPHQVEGLKFLYHNIIDDPSSFDRKNGGFGCILAHSMGLGKTFQSISFIEIFFRCTESTHALVVVPVNTLHNWSSEFDKWLPPRNRLGMVLGFLQTEYTRPFEVFCITEQERTFKQRFNVLNRWKSDAGVLIIGYELFRTLVSLHLDLQGKAKKKFKKFNPQAQEVFEILCDPGPDLVICDEGHRIKNEEAAICHAIKSIRTRRRIMLTGYPLQNNLLEYWCMIDFVRPNYLGSKKEFRNIFLRPIENGQCQNSMPEDVRIMLQRTHVLHHMLSEIIQRKSEEILAQSLPPKLEYVLFTCLSRYQSQLYDIIVNDLREERSANSSINPLLAFAICCKIWNHPEILYRITKRCCSAPDLSRSLVEDEEGEFPTRRATCNEFYNLVSDPQVIRNCFKGYEPELLENGPKFLILFEILEASVSIGEKILVFSQSIPTLNLLERFLQKSFVPNQFSNLNTHGLENISYSHQLWRLNYNYFRLDGSSNSLDRYNMVSNFNDPDQHQVKLFLISTRAGSLGINLIAASRIIILDVSWNPCHDAQAVCRSYRYGQIRKCFVYRLIADGTFESKMYKRQISKISTSDRVVDQLRPERIVTKEDIFSAITSPVDHVDPIDNLYLFSEEYSDPIIKNLCLKRLNVLTRAPLLHESFFTDSFGDHLNESEQKEASEIYTNEKMICRQREVTSRELNDIHAQALHHEPYDYSNNLELHQLEDGMLHFSERSLRPPYEFSSTPFEAMGLNQISPNFQSTSPISITDSVEDWSNEQPPQHKFTPISTPTSVNLMYSPELQQQSVLFSPKTIESSSANELNISSYSSQDPIITILDSPKLELSDSDNDIIDLIPTTNSILGEDSHFCPMDENIMNNDFSAESSSVIFIKEILNISGK
ncbi:hypothetical protein LOD99_2185 [Oopsacas minuta]|uniref:Uncharacterized protein n=1 Tax=Oopsacas minuta TaxID=111878 RepID=A0AAV7K2Q6_9METZ|nr:hypothetical protein LOD99_2185 [Oopsacas minuta]